MSAKRRAASAVTGQAPLPLGAIRAIKVVPWQNDFIAALGRHLTTTRGQNLGSTLVVFPHRRPARYLTRQLATDPDLAKPCLLPRMSSYHEFTAELARRLAPEPLRLASRLDRIELLYSVVRDLAEDSSGLLGRLPLSRGEFFPWGVRLADLMEELLRHDATPHNLAHVAGEVLPWAAALLEELGDIHTAYLQRLAELGYSTPGLAARSLARESERAAELLQGKLVVAAGFYALSGAEDRLLRHLWGAGLLEVVWHSDVALTPGGAPGGASGAQPHWSTREHRHWLSRWQALPLLLEEPAGPDLPELRFHQGFDVHSQLLALHDELEAQLARDGSLERTAVALPSTGLMVPVLHTLPAEEMNISMGYPLQRSAVARLVETILELQESAVHPDAGPPAYAWRSLIRLIRHPYIKMLGQGHETPGTAEAFRRLLRQWEAQLRCGDSLADPLALAPSAEAADDPAWIVAEELRRELCARCLDAFAGLQTLAELAEALTGLCEFLIARGSGLWKRFLVDAECLARLMGPVTHELRASLMSPEPAVRGVLFAVLRQLMTAERVSFEPEPLTGLQLIGMLESRLLSFRTLYVLDATEDALPGSAGHDPLLPDPLRAELGLPDTRERENVAAYSFRRLLAGASEAVICYQSGVKPGLLDDKAIRSRYVEELIWELEQRRGKLIEPGTPPLSAVRLPLAGLIPPPGPLPRFPAVNARLQAMIFEGARPGLSPSALDAYLTCPRRFLAERVLGLQPLDEVSEEGGPAELGTLVHQVLHDWFLPRLNRPLSAALIPADELVESLITRLREQPFFRRMAADKRLAMEQAGRVRLERFAASLPDTTVLQLEQEVAMALECDGREVRVHGRLDRVDSRHGDVIVLDYKTGKARKPAEKFWSDAELFERVAAYRPGSDPDLLPLVARRVKSLQLPLYGAMFAHEDVTPANAGVVELGHEGGEALLFPRKPDLAAEVFEGRAVELARLVVRHMLGEELFEPHPGVQCRWCPQRRGCGG